MTIWVDGDSLPRDIRSLILRREGAVLRGTEMISVRIVSARRLPDIPPPLQTIVEPGEDSADKAIASGAAPGDLVITRDIVFAERMVQADIACINDRGEVFSKASIAERRSLRDAAEALRFSGLAPDSPKGNRRTGTDTKRFADALDRTLARLAKAP